MSTTTCLRKFSSRASASDSSPPNNEEKSKDSFGVIYDPPSYPIPATNIPNLSECIRCGISGFHQEDYAKDTGMSILFLGTSAGIPTKTRSTTSTLLRMGGSSFLFDAGEGLQRQLAFTRARPSQIERIFITHLHGDHIFGLPGILLGLQHSVMLMQSDKQPSKKKNELPPHVVKVYGPPGIYNFIAASITLSCTVFHSIHIEVYELVGGRVRRSHGAVNVRSPFEANYPEFNFGCMSRKFIHPEDGVWNIHDFPRQISRGQVLSGTHNKKGGRNNKNSTTMNTQVDRKVRIQAAELDHLSGVATFGFVIEEDEPPGNIDPVKAKALGVSPQGKKYDLLKHGFSVLTDDGTKEVKPEQVLKPRTKKARKVAIVGDNRAWTPQLLRLAQNADVLVHEATLVDGEDWARGHSTPEMAGNIAGRANAKLLLLNHISSKSDRLDEDGNSMQLNLIKRANEASDGKFDTLVSYDFMEILLPWLGFASGQDGINCATATPPLVETTGEEQSMKSETEVLKDTKEVLEKWFGNSAKTASK